MLAEDSLKSLVIVELEKAVRSSQVELIHALTQLLSLLVSIERS